MKPREWLGGLYPFFYLYNKLFKKNYIRILMYHHIDLEHLDDFKNHIEFLLGNYICLFDYLFISS